jgi:capsular polysaccharide biosynthesis protein
MKAIVAELEAEQNALDREAVEAEIANAESTLPENKAEIALEAVKSESRNVLRVQRLDLEAQRETTRREIAQAIQSIGKIESQIAVYQKKVENASKHEMELLALERNYDNLQRTYKGLLDRKLESDIAVNLEKKQKGQSFRVIDQAKVPQRPVSPDMKKILLFCVAAGIGIGAALIFLLDLLDRSIKIPQDAERQLGVPVLATIPERVGPQGFFRHRINQAMSFVFALVGFGLFSILALMSLRGVESTLNVARKLL